MHEIGNVTESKGIEVERRFAAAQHDVWEYLTDELKMTSWLGIASLERALGGLVSITFGADQGGSQIIENTVSGVVTHFDPESRLTFSWELVGDTSVPSSEVTFTLESDLSGTLLRVTQLPVLPDHISRTLGGWHSHLEVLAERLAGTEPRPLREIFEEVLPQCDVVADEAVHERTMQIADF